MSPTGAGDAALPAPMVTTPSGADDAELLLRAGAGDGAAYEELVARHQRAVHALLWRMTGDVVMADELTHDTFVRAWERRAQFRRGEAMRPWLMAMAVNMVRDEWRRRRIVPNTIDDEAGRVADPAPGPAELAAEAEQRELLARAVARLRGEEAALFHLRYAERMEIEAIGRATGQSANAVTVALHRLRAKLRRLVGAGEENP